MEIHLKKKLSIIFLNLIILVLLFFVLDYLVYLKAYRAESSQAKRNNLSVILPKYNYAKPLLFNPDFDSFYKNKNDDGFRNAEGLNYNKKPILIFGCSFAFGQYLNKEQTFSYKLSKLSHRPVYNRASPAWSIQHMLYQLRQKDFYKIIPEPEYIIYVMPSCHFERLYKYYFSISLTCLELRYVEKSGALVQVTENPLTLTFKRFYLLKWFNSLYVDKVLSAKRNQLNNFKNAALYFEESKRVYSNYWKNTKFIILLYHGFEGDEDFAKMMREKGFVVIENKHIISENLNNLCYFLPDGHPNEKAWDMITPALIKELKL